MLFLLAIPVAGLAQSPAGIPYPWNRISLTDYHMKPGIGWPLQDVTPEGGLPLWVPVGAGLVGGGVIIWLLTDGDNPSGTPLELRADAANSTCGQTVMVNVLTNDAGEGLTLVNVSTISGATVNWTSSGQVTIANATTLGTFNLTVTVEDNQGQTATSTLAVTIQPAALTLTDDEFTTASGVPATGNVLANDAGVNVQVTDVGTTADGEVTITATGNLTFTPAPGFSGTTTFTYTVADQCGQEAMATVTINVQPPGCSFTATVTSTPADCGLPTGSVTATIDEPGDYTYLWSDGSTVATVTGLPAGEYSLTVNTSDGLCPMTYAVTVGSNPITYFGDITTTPGNCLGEGASATAVLTTPGAGPLVVSINDGPGQEVAPGTVALGDLTTLLPGTYSLSIYDQAAGAECAQTTEFTITDNSPSPQATDDNFTTPFQTPVSGNVLDNDMALQPELTGVSSETGGTVTFAPDGSFTFTPALDFTGTGGFTYTLMDACGQTTTATVTINVQPPGCSFTATVTSTPADCGLPTGSVMAAIDEPGDYTYFWSDGSTVATVSGLLAGDYSLTVNTSDGLCPMTYAVTVGSNPITYFGDITTTPGNCLGEGASATTLLTTPGAGPLVVTINDNTPLEVASGPVALGDLALLLPGTYNLSVYDQAAGAGCAQTTQFTIANNSPAPQAINDNYTTPFQLPVSGNVLDNDTALQPGLIDVSGETGGTVTFTSNGNFTFTPAMDFTGTGGFTYTLTDACDQTATATVTINVQPPGCSFVTTVTSTPADCGLPTGSVMAMIDEPGDYTYLWSDGSTTATVTGLPAGDYSLTVNTGNGLCPMSYNVTVGSAPITYIGNITTTPGNCLGDGVSATVVLSTPGTGPLAITINDGPEQVVAPGMIMLNSFVDLVPGDYMLFVYDLAAGPTCAETGEFTIEDTSPAPQTTDDNYTTAFGLPVSGNVLTNDSALQPELTDVSGETGGTVTFATDGSFTFTPTPGFVGLGGFTYTLTDACGVMTTAEVSVLVTPPSCDFSTTITSNPTACGLATGSLMAVVDQPGEYVFTWSTGDMGPSLTGLAAGIYGLTITTIGGFCPQSGNVPVATLGPSYILGLTVIGGNCLGEGANAIINLTTPGPGPLVLNLSDGTVVEVPAGQVSLADYTTLFPGNYTLDIYDQAAGSDCAQSINFTILDTSPSPNPANDNFTTPFGIPVSGNVLDNDFALAPQLTAVSNEVGGAVSFSANGEFTFTPTNGFSGAGGFTYTLTDACGNTAMATVVVNVLPLPCTFTANLAITAPNCGLNDGTASATVSEPGDYTYQWSDGQVGPVVSGLGPGDYSVTITQAGTGCMLEGAFTLEEMSPDYLGSVTIQHPTCVSGGQISFTASVPVADMVFVSVDGPDGTFNFLTPPGLIQLSDQIALPPGDYTIALQDPEIGPACQDVFTVTLDPPPAGPLIGLESIMPPSSPSGSDGSMTIVITAFNTPPFIVLLNGSQWGIVSNPVFTIGELAGGTYEVMLINALGCASNILMVDIPFARPGWQLATDLMAPPVRWAGDGGVEHPLGEASWPVNGLGGSLAYKWASERRLQLSWWPSFAPAGGSLTGRFSWQQGWHRPRWSLHTGPAFYLTDQLPGGAGQWAWQNNLQWRLPDVHGWQLQGEWAFGRQENWWLAGQLGIRVRW